ncbi:MAG: SET domain-containing protein-lysine N-methyltransferase [Bordetella sp. SCN 68-11]|nr:SET domain-containing protein-lysine N-methyltransferase [Burkholderiales bacterium]ODU85483.1 MAG: SET domain-containing protein-lysine N-methyltransferase [Bordetella sp. SCN 68-11]
MTKKKTPSRARKSPVAEQPAEDRVDVDPGPGGKPWYIVRRSRVHGTGVFAARKIPAGTRVIEYSGERISAAEADRRHPVNPEDPYHTFFFALESGKVIDGGSQGNDARWINHACEPNCEAEETDDGRVFIVSQHPIDRGDELNYDYGLVIDERITRTLQKNYQCLCGAETCRGTMLALKRRKNKKKKKA